VITVPAALAPFDLVGRGKVREIYAAGEDRLLMVASDRVSTYDAVHPTPVPGKGQVLTGLSVFWFEATREICPNHLVSYVDGVPDAVRGRALLVERLDMLPLECVVRGHLAGSGWNDYLERGAVAGITLPPGLLAGERLPRPIFTPATKAEEGHDVTVGRDEAAAIAGGAGVLEELCERSVALYSFAAERLRRAGIILADTKFEWGRDRGGRLVLADEALTPDSSRLWPADGHRPGAPQASWDKQYVRDWATGSGWDRTPPAPALPPEVVEGTAARYREAYERITGEPISAWLERSGAPQ
jgi:phosphoribosylaminoimidazole-succinocarboxamide synthase